MNTNHEIDYLERLSRECEAWKTWEWLVAATMVIHDLIDELERELPLWTREGQRKP